MRYLILLLFLTTGCFLKVDNRENSVVRLQRANACLKGAVFLRKKNKINVITGKMMIAYCKSDEVTLDD